MENDAKEITEESSTLDFDDGLVSTVEYRIPEAEGSEDPEADDGPVEADTTPDPSVGAEHNTPGDPKDFHEHPRFKELIEEKNALKSRLAELEQKVVPPADKEDKATYDNIMQMEDEAIVDEFTNNPKKFLGKFAQQLYHEFSGQLSARQKATYEKHQQTVQQRTYEDSLKEFFITKPDGMELLQNGQLQKYLQANPQHNPFSAYHELTRDKAIQAETEKARKAERERVLKELKAKGHARSHAGAPSGNGLSSARSPELKNPDRYGGRNTVLLDRLRQREAGTI